jgi:hypothetical protein
MTPEQQRAMALATARARAQQQQPQGGVSTNTEAVGELKDKLRAMMTGAANGASFGFGDNIAGAIGGVGSMARGDGFMRGYNETLDIVREGMSADQQANPGPYGVGNVAGAMVPAIAAGPLGTGGSLLGTTGRGMGLGAAEGALHGAGNANGQNVMGEAAQGAGIGAAMGGAAPAIIKGLAATKNAALDPATGIIDGMLNRANVGKSNRAIASAFQSSGKTQDEIGRMLMQAAQQGQPEFRMMDALGLPGQRQASGVARGGGDAATEIAEFLASRQAAQGERVGGFVEDAFDVRGTTAAQTTDRLTKARGDAANTAYDAARGNAAPVDVRGALDVIDARIGGMQGSGIAGDGIDGKLSAYRRRLAGSGEGFGDDVTSAELSDFDRVLGVKQAVQDDIGAAVRAGRNNEARELGKLVSELDAALEGASDMYRTANDGFREASRVIGAVDEGAAMSRPSARAADTTAQFGAMNADQQGAARIGYGDRLLAQIEANSSPTANRAKPLQSPKRAMEADTVAVDAPLYRDRLSRENTMWETQNKALGGSRTADNLADMAGTNQVASGVLGVGRSLANFQIGDAVGQAAGLLAPLAKGQNDATRQLIARALMSNDPVKALAPALRQAAGSESKRRMIEGLLRNLGRVGMQGSGN